MICFIREIAFNSKNIAIVHAKGDCDTDAAIRRMKQMASGNPRRLRLIGFMAGGDGARAMIQDWFSRLHINGDWYRMSGEILAYISRYADCEPVDTMRRGGSDHSLWLDQIEGRPEIACGPRNRGGYRRTIADGLSPAQAKQRVLRAHLATRGNTSKAARLLKVSRRTVTRWISSFGLEAAIADLRKNAPR